MKVAGELLADAEKRKRELDFQGAARAFRQSLRPSRRIRSIFGPRRSCYLIEARNEDAARVLQEVVRQRPDYAPVYLMLGMLCARKVACEADESKLYLETFLELTPEDINADLARRELANIQ